MNPLYKTELFEIRCLTNLHVGIGKTDYGRIDNKIQRDALTGFPCIFESSFKGALRQFFRILSLSGKLNSNINVDTIFGKEPINNFESEEGSFLFQSAQLLSIPIRSNTQPFFHVTCPAVITDLINTIDFFNAANLAKLKSDLLPLAKSIDNIYCSSKVEPSTYLENTEFVVEPTPNVNINNSSIKTLIAGGNDFIIVPDSVFNALVNDEHLPIITRNKLDNGESKNLWIEQFVPRESRFLAKIMVPLTENDTNLTAFISLLNNAVIQIGGNASIGQGQCLFTHL
jgi:CRISPR-associated protein Cmr4